MGFGDRFEIMILLRVKAKSLLCYWAVRDLGIGMAQIARRLNLSLNDAWLFYKGNKTHQLTEIKVNSETLEAQPNV